MRTRTPTLAALLTALCASSVHAENSSPQEIEEIVVTGTKISRSLQDTPTSVAVFDAGTIEDQNIINIQDVIDRTANLTTSDGNRFNIRGIDSLNVSGAGLADLATIYIDGSPLPRDATLNGPLDVWDLDQIEIFRGPQSTLQGRNSLAGAVVLNTAEPTYVWEGRARAIAGNEADERRISGAIGGPILDNQLAFRLAAEVAESDGVVENLTIGGNEDEQDSLMVCGKLLFEPAAIENLSATLAYTHDDREFGDTIVDLSIDDARDTRQIFSNRRARDNVELDIGVLTLEYDLSDTLSLTSITAVNKTRRSSSGDSDHTASDIEFGSLETKTTTTPQELRLQIDRKRFSAVVGAYYANIDTPDSLNDVTVNIDPVNDLRLVDTLVGGFGLDLPTAELVASFYAEPISVQAQANNPIEIESYALFTDFAYDLSDSFTLYGGIRLDRESQDITTGNSVTIEGTLPNPTDFTPPLVPLITGINAQIIASAQDATSEPESVSSPKFDAFLPKLGIGWNIDHDRSLSFTIQRGYRSGGIGINIARAQGFEFDEEFIWNYELSMRSQWLANKLTVNANAFYIDWQDQQVNVQLSGNVFDQETQNAGSSSIYGFELEGAYQLNSLVKLYGSVGLAESEFEEFTGQVNGVAADLSGNEFAFSPKLTLAGGVTWRSQHGFVGNLNANYNSAAFTRADRPQTDREIENRLLVNFRAGWETDRFGVFVTGNNLLDEDNLLSLIAGDTAGSPVFARFAAPRTFALQLQTQF